MKKKDLRSKDENLRDRQLRMAILLAEMKSTQEVADIIAEEFHIKETRDNVYGFSQTLRGKKIITSLRNKFLTELTKIPIANKAVRLKRLDTVYNQSMTESLKSINQWGEIYELKLGAAIEALKAAREEIEPTRIEHFGTIEHNVFFENMISKFTSTPNRIAERLNASNHQN